VRSRITDLLINNLKTGVFSKGMVALAFENPDVAMQVVGQKVNDLMDSAASEVTGFVGK
jgi:hypothetical protein